MSISQYPTKTSLDSDDVLLVWKTEQNKTKGITYGRMRELLCRDGVPIYQGTENKGKRLIVQDDGNIGV